MKMRNTNGKKPARRTSRSGVVNMPRMFLFLELFVDKEIPQRSTK
jgi:hypothetical protein